MIAIDTGEGPLFFDPRANVARVLAASVASVTTFPLEKELNPKNFGRDWIEGRIRQ